MMTDLDMLLQQINESGKVCPMPMYWKRLYELLPGGHRRDAGFEPSLPLILGAWHVTSDAEKRRRFFEHLRWANEHGVLHEIIEFIGCLNPEDWHTAGP